MTTEKKKQNKYVARRYAYRDWAVFLFADLPKYNQRSGGVVDTDRVKPVECCQDKGGAYRTRDIYNGPEIDLRIYKANRLYESAYEDVEDLRDDIKDLLREGEYYEADYLEEDVEKAIQKRNAISKKCRELYKEKEAMAN